MTKRQLALLLLDCFATLSATVFAVYVRANLDFEPQLLLLAAPYIASSLVVAVIVLSALGVNRRLWRFTTLGDCIRLCNASFFIVVGAGALTFSLNRLDGVPRSLPLLQIVFLSVALIGARIARRLWAHTAERRAAEAKELSAPIPETILLVGLGRLAEYYIRAVSEMSRERVRIAGILAPTDDHNGHFVRGCQVLGSITDIQLVLRRLETHGVEIDQIVVVADGEDLTQAQRDALYAIEQEAATPVAFLRDQLHLPPRRTKPASPDTEQVFSLAPDKVAELLERPYWKFRRVADIFGAAFLIVALAPVALLVAILTAIDLGLPVLFWQQRPGFLGRPFRVYKFRTMKPAHDENGERIPDEKRSSGLGRFLRRTRLDEYPQLLNILAGEMSFIGPRPLLPIDQPPEFAARQLARPGLTGWAQVVGGRAITASDKSALDVWYVLNASPWLDAEIVVRTIMVLFFGEQVDSKLIHDAWTELDRNGVCVLQMAE